jgi:hypothetical protein
MGWNEDMLETLKAVYPTWELWIVHVHQPPGVTWCARPVGAPSATINVGSPEELIEAIGEQS